MIYLKVLGGFCPGETGWDSVAWPFTPRLFLCPDNLLPATSSFPLKAIQDSWCGSYGLLLMGGLPMSHPAACGFLDWPCSLPGLTWRPRPLVEGPLALAGSLTLWTLGHSADSLFSPTPKLCLLGLVPCPLKVTLNFVARANFPLLWLWAR